jgi:hypothetical protein
MTTGEEIMTVNQINAMSRVGQGFDFFQKTIRQALQAGVRPEKIIDFLDGSEAQISRAVTRKIIEREVMVDGEVQPDAKLEIENGEMDDTIVINDDDDTIVISDRDE